MGGFLLLEGLVAELGGVEVGFVAGIAAAAGGGVGGGDGGGGFSSPLGGEGEARCEEEATAWAGGDAFAGEGAEAAEGTRAALEHSSSIHYTLYSSGVSGASSRARIRWTTFWLTHLLSYRVATPTKKSKRINMNPTSSSTARPPCMSLA